MPELLRYLFDDVEYIPRQRIAKSVLEKSMLLPDRMMIVEGEDFMRFKIGDTRIMFCETTVLSSRGEDVLFNGVFISASFNKYFTAKTFVCPEKSKSFFRNLKRRILDNLCPVKLEDVEFNKEFFVLSSDQVEARYILTPSLMLRIMNYRRKIKKGISFSFVDDRLYCAIPNYINLFEPALFEHFDFEFIKRNYLPLKLYTDLVEDLNLNNQIWSKQPL